MNQVHATRFLCLALCSILACACTSAPAPDVSASHELIIRGGTLYDGTGGAPQTGDVVVDGDRIVYVGPSRGDTARTVIDAAGQAVAPGFINMLSWAVESLLVDGRALSDLRQGVTLEVFGEGDSMGPLNASMRQQMIDRQVDIRYDVPWSTLGGYLEFVASRGIAPNVASLVGASTVRVHELGEADLDPSAEQLGRMRMLVHDAMEEGALGVGASLIYAPAAYANTDELVALAGEAASCGGIYTAHMRSEADRLAEAVAETIEISRRSGAPAEIYHLKFAGQRNWSKFDSVIGQIDAARRDGVQLTANMYTYIAGATGLDASMPLWVQEGGLEAWIARLKDPQIRARVIAEMRSDNTEWENLLRMAGGADNVLLTGFRSAALKPLAGKRLSEVASLRGVSAEDTAIDLVIEDGTRVDATYFMMSEDNVRKQIALPYVSFGSDEAGPAPEGIFLQSISHPRAYGNVARLLGRYVRDEGVISLSEAVRRLTSLPASNLHLRDRGLLKAGYYADIVVFDPATVGDRATFEQPAQLATGVAHVVVNGGLALTNGEPTNRATGRVVRGRAWRGWSDGGCRKSAAEWSWNP